MNASVISAFDSIVIDGTITLHFNAICVISTWSSRQDWYSQATAHSFYNFGSEEDNKQEDNH